jgi:hypothetical protein
VRLVDQWTAVETGLDPRWHDARLDLVIGDEVQRQRALALLGPASPGRVGTTIRFTATRSGVGIGPEAARRLLRRLDAEGIGGTLTLVSSDEAPAAPAIARRTLADEWTAALALLPSDWSDLLGELELTSTEHIEKGALLLAPLNPVLGGTGRPGFRFRSAQTFGYGASPGMVHRCLARLDEAGIPGEVRILRAVSDAEPVGTQGVVWYVGGRAV